MSKAACVRKLLHLSNDEIVSRTGISKDYVRAVRQRTDEHGNATRCPAESRYQSIHRGTFLAYRRSYMRRYRAARAQP